MNKDRVIEAALGFYFHGLVEGYVLGRVPKCPVPGVPDMMERRIEKDGFLMIDRYTRTLGTRKSVGHIMIAYEGQLIWSMTGRGRYDKSVIPFLKLALGHAFTRQRFEGGRGPGCFTHKDFPGHIYNNSIQSGKFGEFMGVEVIAEDLTIHGSYRYEGGLLI